MLTYKESPGLLILAIIGFIISGAIVLYDLLFAFSGIGFYYGYMTMAIFLDLIFLTLIVGSLILILKKSRYASIFAIIAHVVFIIWNLLMIEMFLSIFFSVLWIIYFSNSKTLKKIFVK